MRVERAVVTAIGARERENVLRERLHLLRAQDDACAARLAADGALGGRKLAREHAQEGRLAGAIGTDEPVPTRHEAERSILDHGRERGECHADAMHFEHEHADLHEQER
jgi:hypothetical protein